MPVDVDSRTAADGTAGEGPGTANSPLPTVLGVVGLVAAGAAACAVAAVAAEAVGWTITVRALLAVTGLAAVNGGLAALAAPRAGTAARVLLGVVLGLATAGMAVWLSGVFGWFWLRWPAAAAPALAWLHPSARAGWRSGVRRSHWRERVSRYGPALWGLAVAWLLAARALADHFAPMDLDHQWRQFYVDIPWHIALTAEGLDRAPTVYPWIPDVPIGYSWLFFGTLALVGNLAGATAAQLVLAVGPAILAIIVPAGLAACAWVVSRSRLATLAAPLLFSFGRAPVFAGMDTLQLTPQWVLINRDSTNAMVLAVVLLLVTHVRSAAERGTGERASRWPFLTAVFLIVFAAAGSRGGAVLPILGAAGLSWLIAVRDRRVRPGTTWALVVIGVAVVGATLAVTRSSGSFRLDPLSFLPGQNVALGPVPLAELASLGVMLAMTGSLLLIPRALPYARPAVPVLVGAALAGVLGTAVFGHPAVSQLYFFHAAWPVLVVGLAVLIAAAVRALGPLAGLALAAAVCAVQLVLQPPTVLPPTPWPVRIAVVATVALLVIGSIAAAAARVHGWRRTTLFVGPVLVVALQPWGLPSILISAATLPAEATSASVSRSQLDLLADLRRSSEPTDLVATNKHCLHGSIADGSCDARWFTVAAFSERRVLVEGWSYDYTWTSSGNDNQEPYWNPDLLHANDGFIADPDAATCRTLWDEGVRWIFVDKREPWSPRIAEHADVLGDAADAALYRLRPECG